MTNTIKLSELRLVNKIVKGDTVYDIISIDPKNKIIELYAYNDGDDFSLTEKELNDLGYKLK